MKPGDIADRLLRSPKGVTPERIDKMIGLLLRSRRSVSELKDMLHVLQASHGVTIASDDVSANWLRRIAGLKVAKAAVEAQPVSRDRDLTLTYMEATIAAESAELAIWKEGR